MNVQVIDRLFGAFPDHRPLERHLDVKKGLRVPEVSFAQPFLLREVILCSTVVFILRLVIVVSMIMTRLPELVFIGDVFWVPEPFVVN